MMNLVKRIWMVGLFLAPSALLSKEGKACCAHKLSGYMFGDYYYVVANHDSTYEGQNGFWFRRIYFTYDHAISGEFSARLRLEMASSDFTKASGKLTPFVKDAYLKWKLKKFDLLLGISSTPTWNLIEKFWGYRSVEKTPLDLQKFGSSRDFGIAFRGKAGPNKRLGYHLMFGNGEGNKSEYNKFKKVMGAIDFELPHLVVQVYGDWEEGKGNTDVYTYQGFVGFKFNKFKIGAHYAQQIRQMEPDTQDTYEIASGFFTFDLHKKITFLTRYDKMFDPSPAGISYIPFAQAKSNLLIGGIDFKPHKNVHFIPNVEYVFYDETNGVKPDADLYLRLTFYYKFK
jgi:hypothetical protein